MIRKVAILWLAHQHHAQNGPISNLGPEVGALGQGFRGKPLFAGRCWNRTKMDHDFSMWKSTE